MERERECEVERVEMDGWKDGWVSPVDALREGTPPTRRARPGQARRGLTMQIAMRCDAMRWDAMGCDCNGCGYRRKRMCVDRLIEAVIQPK